MDPEVDWEAIEDSCPENRELGEIVRWLGGLQGGDSPLDWKESRRRCADLLLAYQKSSDKSQELAERLLYADYEVGGDEHHLIRVEDEPDRVFKVTHGDAFGCYSYFSPHDPDLKGKHFHGTLNDDPIFYLRRWMILNAFTDYVTQFEGILPPQGDSLILPRICISQAALDLPAPSARKIERHMAMFGFKRISQDAYLEFESRILLTDAAPRNVRIGESTPEIIIPDGFLALFDAIACIASDRVIDWAMSQQEI